jgi:hypothetical protein
MTQTKAICTIEGCEARATARGLCAKHYMRARRHDGDPNKVNPPGAPRNVELNAWKAEQRAKLSEMIGPSMSARTFDRYCSAIGKLERLVTPEALQAVLDEVTVNGRFRVSRFAALTEFIIRRVEERRRKREAKARRRLRRRQARTMTEGPRRKRGRPRKVFRTRAEIVRELTVEDLAPLTPVFWALEARRGRRRSFDTDLELVEGWFDAKRGGKSNKQAYARKFFKEKRRRAAEPGDEDVYVRRLNRLLQEVAPYIKERDLSEP